MKYIYSIKRFRKIHGLLQAMATPYLLSYKATDFSHSFGDLGIANNLYHSDWWICLSTCLLKFHSDTMFIFYCFVKFFSFSLISNNLLFGSVFSCFCYTVLFDKTQLRIQEEITDHGFICGSNTFSAEIRVSLHSASIQKRTVESFFL